MAKLDTTVATQKVMMTRDYDQFKTLEGNREVNMRHVNQLIRLMLANGNLTDQRPITVDKKGYVIDGQHRLEALKTLGWDVGYVVEDKATIDTVRAINQGNKNWTWRDQAESFAKLGNEHYEWFLLFIDTHQGISYTLAMAFCNAKMNKRSANEFSMGTFEMTPEMRNQAVKFADQFLQLREIAVIGTHDFGKALNVLFRSPFYDHDRMMKKMKERGHTLPVKASDNDYRRMIEEIFNYGYSDENKHRLF